MQCDSPVSMVGSEPAVMSVFSSDTDPDIADKLRHLQPLLTPVSPVSASPSLASQSCYPAPAVPIQFSAVSAVPVSSGLDRTLQPARTLDAFLLMNSLGICRVTFQ